MEIYDGITIDEFQKGFDLAGQETAGGQSRIREVLRAIDDLPETHRQCVYLRYIEEYTPEEIAVMLGLEVNTVSVRIHRGKALLRDNE
jgi:RNA polymerase sigma factor (sigma-70 family)